MKLSYIEIPPAARPLAWSTPQGDGGPALPDPAGGTQPRRRLATVYVLIGLALALPAAMLGLSVLMAWQALWSQAEERAQQAADGAAEYATRMLNSYMLAADRISEATRGMSEAEIRADEGRWHRHLQGQIGRLLSALDAKLIATDGSVLAAASASPPPGASMATREHFTALAQVPPGALWISRAHESAASGRWFFAVSRSRPEPDRGAVVVAIDQASFGEGLARVSVRDGETIAILRLDGEVLTRHPPLPGSQPRIPPGAKIRQEMAQERPAGLILSTMPATGEPILVAYRRLVEHPRIYAVFAMPRAMIMQRWWQDVWHVLAFGVLAMFALGALGWRVARQHAFLLGAKAELEVSVAERSAQLSDEGQRLTLALDSAKLGTWEMDLVRGKIWRSSRMRHILGVPHEAEITDYPDSYSYIHPDDVTSLKAGYQRLLCGDRSHLQVELRFRLLSGGWGWLEAFGRVARRDPTTGAPQILTGVARDITVRKQAEAKREEMIRELDHRAKNILAVIQSILRLSAKEDPAHYASRVEGRIAALSRAQALLSAEGWSGADLAAVLSGEVAPFAGIPLGEANTARFTLEGPALRVASQAVQPLVLALHELASNARDHGAFQSPQGQVAISWQRDVAAGLLRLRWVESGGAPAKAPTLWNVGGKLIRVSLQTQLRGSFTPEWREAGFAADIALPLDCLTNTAVTGA